MAQTGPMTDVTQRLFVELKSKNEETRVRAAYELYDNVLSVSRGMNVALSLFQAIVA
jgi:FKBP12-rapamycin complex-associated protein